MRYFRATTDVTYMIWAEDETDAQNIILEALKRGLTALGREWTMTPNGIEITDLGLEENGTSENEVKKDKETRGKAT